MVDPAAGLRIVRSLVAVGVVNSHCELLVGDLNEEELCPSELLAEEPEPGAGSSSLHPVVQVAARILHARFGLVHEVHVKLLGFMSDDEAIIEQTDDGGARKVCWVLFQNCSDIAEVMPRLIVQPRQAVAWLPLSMVVNSTPVESAQRQRYEGLAAWAPPIVQVFAGAVDAIDLTGTWSRNATRNVRVIEGLIARGLATDKAQAEASRSYVQRWDRAGEESSWWQVTTFAPNQDTNESSTGKTHRTLVYPLGDWEEVYSGGSLLYGSAGGSGKSNGDGLLVRCTEWIPVSDAWKFEARALLPRSILAERPTGRPSATSSLFAHTTWTTRTDHEAEITSRFLLEGHMIVRRTWLPSLRSMHPGLHGESSQVPESSIEIFAQVESSTCGPELSSLHGTGTIAGTSPMPMVM